MDSGLVASQAAEVEKAPMVEGCPAVGGRVTMWGLTELLRYTEVEGRFFLQVPLVHIFFWIFLALSWSWLCHEYFTLSPPICVESGPRVHYTGNLQLSVYVWKLICMFRGPSHYLGEGLGSLLKAILPQGPAVQAHEEHKIFPVLASPCNPLRNPA